MWIVGSTKTMHSMTVQNCFQFAGGFDTESMKAFEELRNNIHVQAGEYNNKLELATEDDQ